MHREPIDCVSAILPHFIERINSKITESIRYITLRSTVRAAMSPSAEQSHTWSFHLDMRRAPETDTTTTYST